MAKGIFLALLSFLSSCLACTYADLLIIQKPITMSSTLMSLVPVLDGSMNWQAWRPMMMNYLLSQGQWKVITNKFRAPDYESTTTVTKTDSDGTHTEMVADTSKPAKNQSEIDSWFDINDRALGNIMLRLHPTIATTVLNLLQKTIEENDDINTMFTSVALEYLDATYGKPGIAATYKELKATMGVIIPGNADPTRSCDRYYPHWIHKNGSIQMRHTPSSPGHDPRLQTSLPDERFGPIHLSNQQY